MSRTILLPLDGSTRAERALPYAGRLAQASGTRLLLLHAVPTSAGAMPHGSPDPMCVMYDARTYLAGVAARCGGRAVVETVVFPGGAAEAILEETRVRSVDLIVMSTHGRSSSEHALAGRVAIQMVQRTQVPILLIPIMAERTWPRDRPLRIVAPLDAYGHEVDDQVLRYLDALAVVVGGELLPQRASVPSEASVPISPSSAGIYRVPPRDPEVRTAGPQAGGRAVALHTAADRAAALEVIIQARGADMVVLPLHACRSLSPDGALGRTSAQVLLLQCARIPLLLVDPATGRLPARSAAVP